MKPYSKRHVLRHLKSGRCLRDPRRLRGADLSETALNHFELDDKNLAGVCLRGARLCNVYLRRACLRDADLTGAYLDFATLDGADLTDAVLDWESVWSVLDWLQISDALITECMRYDASKHPRPEVFGIWASGGPCPYSGRYFSEQRPIPHFKQRRDLWEAGDALPAEELSRLLCEDRGIRGYPFKRPAQLNG